MEHLFLAWASIAPRLKAARKVFLFSDFDGTLTPIVERPEDAVLDPEVRGLLQALASSPRFFLGIISGRALVDLQAKVAVPSVIFAGNHGLEISGPGLNFLSPLVADMKSTIRLIHSVLERTVTGIKGVVLEDKGLTLSVHYRQVAEPDLGNLTRAFRKAVGTAQMLGKIRVTTGKKVYEVRPPVDWNKGKALEHIMDRLRSEGRHGPTLSFYLGDDMTDEDAFRAINRLGGVSVYVGEGTHRSEAQYYVTSADEVAEFLRKLAEPA